MMGIALNEKAHYYNNRHMSLIVKYYIPEIITLLNARHASLPGA